MPNRKSNLSWVAQLMLQGISRKEAAEELFLSQSAVNKKLRGQVPFTPQEEVVLRALVERRTKG